MRYLGNSWGVSMGSVWFYWPLYPQKTDRRAASNKQGEQLDTRHATESVVHTPCGLVRIYGLHKTLLHLGLGLFLGIQLFR